MIEELFNESVELNLPLIMSIATVSLILLGVLFPSLALLLSMFYGILWIIVIMKLTKQNLLGGR